MPAEGVSKTIAAPPSAAPVISVHGWLIPSTVSLDPDQARAFIVLPHFAPALIQTAETIAEYFPFAASECRTLRDHDAASEELDLSRFERVFRVAAAIANVHIDKLQYDDLLVLSAWHCVRPNEEGFLGCYPKSLLCPLSHSASPEALNALPPAKRLLFERRVPVYLRYLLTTRFSLRTCADIENADLRQLLRAAGFRLVRASAVPEIAFPGVTRGDDPAVRPWKLTLRQELTDERAAEMLVQAAVWQIKYSMRLVTFHEGHAVWNIGAFARVDWEDTFLSLGVRVAPSLTRESGLLDWRAVLRRCLDQIGTGNLPAELLGKVAASPQRVSHDSEQGIWSVLDQVSQAVLDSVRASEPHLFHGDAISYRAARSFRRWARVFDEISPNVLSRFGVTAFSALHRVAPHGFGWGREQLKPWEVEQEHGKWKGARGRAMLRSAYAFALHEAGLGSIEYQNEHVLWRCTQQEFNRWSAIRAENEITPYDYLYRLASRHGLTPLLNREITHTAAVSLLAGVSLHQNLPRVEGSWHVCMRAAFDIHNGRMDVRLDLPDLAPLPLRLRKATLLPLDYTYLHKQIRLVREFDRQMARDSRRKLEEIPGWWEDERIIGTPLEALVGDRSGSVRPVLESLRSEPWLQAHRVRFRALQLLTSNHATLDIDCEFAPLSSEAMRTLLRFAYVGALEHSNVVHVSIPAVRRGFDRILARSDTRELIDSLLLHVGAAYETEQWGQVRRYVVLDVINDLLAMSVRMALLHLMTAE
jgi:hypothetical protein